MTEKEVLDNIQDIYNKYTLLPEVPYNIASYLINYDDTIWRLLKYNTNTAWNVNVNPNLTNADKGKLIYKGDGTITDYRVFLDPGMDQAWNETATMLRISPVELWPSNHVYGIQCIRFEVYYHTTLAMLSNGNPRGLSILQRVIEVLNGAEIKGIGRLWFSYRASSRCRMTSINVGNPTFKGYDLIMCNNALG